MNAIIRKATSFLDALELRVRAFDVRRIRHAAQRAHAFAKAFAKATTPERAIAVITIAFGIWVALTVYDKGLTLAFLDQNAHLNLAREVSDSLTPGLSQIGFWPPLLHIVMAPAAAIDVLYHTGLAAAVTLIPFLVLGTLFFYRLIRLHTNSRTIGIAAAFAFILNPYVLYYAVTPMMEMIFIPLVIGALYFTSRWYYEPRLRDLNWTAIFVTLASAARFEGFILIPLIALVIAGKRWFEGRDFAKIESEIILFLFLGLIGVGFIACYSSAYGGSPLAFISGNWSARTQQADYTHPAAGSISRSVQYFASAAIYSLGGFQLLLAFLGAILALALSSGKTRWVVLGLMVLAASPALFNLLSLYIGQTVIYVPNLPPYKGFFNERYGLLLVITTIIAPLLGASALWQKSKVLGAPDLRALLQCSAIAIVEILLIANVWFLGKTVWADDFAVLRNSAQRYPIQIQLAKSIRTHYDYGNILATRALYDFTLIRAGINLDHYIHEANFQYFSQALDHPWLYARWVIMIKRNPNIYTSVQLENEAVSKRWDGNKEFLSFYAEVDENDGARLYRVNETAVLRYAREHNLDPSTTPSLNPEGNTW